MGHGGPRVILIHGVLGSYDKAIRLNKLKSSILKLLIYLKGPSRQIDLPGRYMVEQV